MKRSILLLFILVVFCWNISYGTTFYVDASKGSDSNNGISQTKAWKTIDKVNMAGLSPGDFVLFKRGGTFRGFLIPESGSSSGYITYGAYGSGEKPKILGSVSRNLTSDWTNVGTNLWQASNINIDTSGIDVGNIIFNNEESCGIKVKTMSDLNAQGKFYSDNNKMRVIMYSVGNPAIYYSTLELALGRNLISPRNKCYFICENLDLRYGGNHGVGGGDTHHMIIRDMDFSYIGGSYLRGFRSGTVRYGNGVEFYNGAYANIIERCTFSQIYDVAMTCQGNKTGYQVYDIYFRNNIVSKCEQSFEFWVRGEGASARNIYFVNNTCIDAGMGWSHSQRPDKNGTHLLFYGSDPNSGFSNIVIRNNIFMNAANSGIYESRSPLPDLDISKITINNNDWYVSGMLRVPPAMYDWNYYRTNTRQDSNSSTSNPLLTSTNSIPSNSPCVDTGVTLSYVTGDFILTSRPQGSACDMGAYEFISDSKKQRGNKK